MWNLLQNKRGGYGNGLFPVILVLVLSASFWLDFALAQVGTNICACQPAVYEITLNFTVRCDEVDVQGPGILETACRIEKETTGDVTDFVPAQVTEIQFLELNSNLQTLQQEARTGSFRTGNIVRYTSVLAVQTSFDEDTLPAAFQVIMRGVNAVDQPIQMFWVITYSNDCGVFPVLSEGQKQGWSIFTDLGGPPQFVCPLAALPLVPSEPPSDMPSDQHTDSAVPSMSPTLRPVKETILPSVAPSEASAPSTIPSTFGTESNAPSMVPNMQLMSPKPTPTINTAQSMQPTNEDCTDIVQSCPVTGHQENTEKNIFFHDPPSQNDNDGQGFDLIPICVQNRFLFWVSHQTVCVPRSSFVNEDEQRVFSLFHCDSYTCGCCDPLDEGKSYPSFCGEHICAQDERRTVCKQDHGWGRGWWGGGGNRWDGIAICLSGSRTICVDELDPVFLAMDAAHYTCGCCDADDADFCTNHDE